MNVDMIFQIAAVGIVVAVLNQILSKYERPEQAMMVTLAGLITVLLLIVNEIKTLFDTIKAIFRL
ncbi:MAG: stage sporulation protein [Clostridia bacterium]|nr:stage sporulation protein [Clostridia bacterium]